MDFCRNGRAPHPRFLPFAHFPSGRDSETPLTDPHGGSEWGVRGVCSVSLVNIALGLSQRNPRRSSEAVDFNHKRILKLLRKKLLFNAPST